ncbi:MAG: SLATT domain-containing protein [Proteobacteria bacterium]|nr:SLATT domain-containing protein [Pseudomonadota bacterium]
MKKKDLKSQSTSFDWCEKNKAKSIEELRKTVAQQAEDSMNWYYEARCNKKWLGYGFRLLAFVFAAYAGIRPLILEIVGSSEPIVWYFHSGSSAVALAIAALFIALDKLFDCTSGWMRYMTSGQKIKQVFDDFTFRWSAIELNFEGKIPTTEQTIEAVEICKETMAKINQIVRDETSAWIEEFRMALRKTDETARTLGVRGRTADPNNPD